MAQISCMPMTRSTALQAFPLVRAIYPWMSLDQWQKRLSSVMAGGNHNGAIVATRGGYVRGVFTYGLAPAGGALTRLEIRDLCVMDILEGDDVLISLAENIRGKVRDLGTSDSMIYLTPAQSREGRILAREGLETRTLCGEALLDGPPSTISDRKAIV